MPEGEIALWRRARRRFFWLLAVVLLKLADRLPMAAGRKLGETLARTALVLRRKDRRVATANLALAFPELDARARDRLRTEAALALGRNLSDTLAAGRILAQPRLVTEEPGPAGGGIPVGDLLAGLAGRGRGVFILTGHLGCWELLGGWLARELKARGLPGLGVVTGTVHNPAVDGLLQDRRRRLGMTVLPRREGAGPLLRYLRSGGVVAVLQDQRTRVQNLDVPFFGTPAPTPAGLARLALRYGIPVVPVAMARRGTTGEHAVFHGPPLAFKEDGGTDEKIEDFLVLCNAKLEEFIRRNPSEWVWFHDRWGPSRRS